MWWVETEVQTYERVSSYARITHCKHVVALHVFSFLVFAFLVKLPEEIKGYDGVEIHYNCQQTHSQHQLIEIDKTRDKRT